VTWGNKYYKWRALYSFREPNDGGFVRSWAKERPSKVCGYGIIGRGVDIYFDFKRREGVW